MFYQNVNDSAAKKAVLNFTLFYHVFVFEATLFFFRKTFQYLSRYYHTELFTYSIFLVFR